MQQNYYPPLTVLGIQCSLLFLYLIVDQPARRGLCGMLASNSKLHPCFGYSMHILALSKPLVACKKCTKSLFWMYFH